MSRATSYTITLVALILATFSIAGCSDPASTVEDAPELHGYHSDLENTVVLAMRRGIEDIDLVHQIDTVARRHSVADWASDDESFKAIGVGLRDAGVSREMAESVAQLVSSGDAAHRDLVLQAYGN